MRILLVNHQHKVRSALRLALAQEPDMEVVGEAEDALAMLSRARLTRPDVMLLDWELPGLRNPDLLFAIHFLFPDLRVVVLSTRPEVQGEAMNAGAAGFVSKFDPPEVLIATLRALNGVAT